MSRKLSAELVSILSDLIALPSPYPPGTSVEICAYAAKRLKKAGYKVEIAAKTKGVDNVVARLKAKTKGPVIAFNAHVDTVGVGERANWKSDPYKALVKGGLVYGLGAGNCKGSMAVQLWLAEEIARRGGPKKGELIFTFVADEENLGPDGMSFLRDTGKVRPDALILGAQTENNLIVAERGVMWARITTKGKAAHAGNPAAGDNAILRMMRLVGALQSYYDKALAKRVSGAMKSTVNIGMFHGGHNTNVVPSACTVEIDRRLLPDEKVKDAFKELKTIVDGVGEAKSLYKVEFLTGTNGFYARENGQAVAAFEAAVKKQSGRKVKFLNATGVSDGRYYADDKIEIINFGPGSGAQGHAANESVPIAEMVEAAKIQLEVVQRLLD
ncbi:succinyl-diaminopimelate desuccinylase [Enhydrobacter aerosaccus]|uniref:Probable succinyl-diaminopimelate desuccinylase n=1 Tax=Enhydrobacter aerosaccus TaxID=225324 RepID=A0A1T4THQ9_9HYPH|nr:ArgE/DapE family deacylase [Enhydrobacter aerosaccus]SKA39967.1 succinyl-diaminopimelate desuccinylase [Enhydrobacter aerosaccus]